MKAKGMKKLLVISMLLLVGCTSTNDISPNISTGINVPFKNGSIYNQVYASRYGVNVGVGTHLRDLLGMNENINVNINW